MNRTTLMPSRLEGFPDELLQLIYKYMSSELAIYAFYGINRRFNRSLRNYEYRIDLVGIPCCLYATYFTNIFPYIGANIRYLILHCGKLFNCDRSDDGLVVQLNSTFPSLVRLTVIDRNLDELESSTFFKFTMREFELSSSSARFCGDGDLYQNIFLAESSLEVVVLKPVCWSPMSRILPNNDNAQNRIIDLTIKFHTLVDFLQFAQHAPHVRRLHLSIGVCDGERVRNRTAFSIFHCENLHTYMPLLIHFTLVHHPLIKLETDFFLMMVRNWPQLQTLGLFATMIDEYLCFGSNWEKLFTVELSKVSQFMCEIELEYYWYSMKADDTFATPFFQEKGWYFNSFTYVNPSYDDRIFTRLFTVPYMSTVSLWSSLEGGISRQLSTNNTTIHQKVTTVSFEHVDFDIMSPINTLSGLMHMFPNLHTLKLHRVAKKGIETRFSRHSQKSTYTSVRHLSLQSYSIENKLAFEIDRRLVVEVLKCTPNIRSLGIVGLSTIISLLDDYLFVDLFKRITCLEVFIDIYCYTSSNLDSDISRIAVATPRLAQLKISLNYFEHLHFYLMNYSLDEQVTRRVFKQRNHWLMLHSFTLRGFKNNELKYNPDEWLRENTELREFYVELASYLEDESDADEFTIWF